MDSRHLKFVLVRYSVASVGLFLVAMGIALSIVSNLGTSPLSSPAYVMEGTWKLSVGNWTIIINMVFMLIQVAVLRKGFKAKYLMQVPATVVFGYMIDLSLLCVRWMVPGTFAARLGLILLSCIITAMGVSIEVIARAWMLSAEMTVYAITKTVGKAFGSIKVAMDCTVLLAAALMSLVKYGNPFGSGEFCGIAALLTGSSEGVIIGLGTLLTAVLAGLLMKFTDPLADRLMDAVIGRFTGSPSVSRRRSS